MSYPVGYNEGHMPIPKSITGKEEVVTLKQNNLQRKERCLGNYVKVPEVIFNSSVFLISVSDLSPRFDNSTSNYV